MNDPHKFGIQSSARCASYFSPNPSESIGQLQSVRAVALPLRNGTSDNHQWFPASRDLHFDREVAPLIE
jgi:hypothetical protein